MFRGSAPLTIDLLSRTFLFLKGFLVLLFEMPILLKGRRLGAAGAGAWGMEASAHSNASTSMASVAWASV